MPSPLKNIYVHIIVHIYALTNKNFYQKPIAIILPHLTHLCALKPKTRFFRTFLLLANKKQNLKSREFLIKKQRIITKAKWWFFVGKETYSRGGALL
jgi:glutaminase